ncbi:hypothetical protein NP493_12g07000 [Ridgeia piscesae]|uniref:Ig-like domain-containing protein n=1 Tax=Ridgeia piscesae TaxID=27915 RepID=A0AAD9PFB9_RIDPI|nr:hypothetical protein NP493_12g07000 [Ridgeia piscesae]
MLLRRRSLETLARMSKMNATLDKNGKWAHVSIPTLHSIDSFDFSGILTTWQLQALMTKARMFAFHMPSKDTGDTFLQYDKLTADRFTFMASVKTTVSRSYYDIPELPVSPSMRVSLCLGYIGTSSLSTAANLNCEETGEVFVHNVNQVVSVDKTTRKPTPLPDWWRTKYASAVVGNERLVIPRFSQPDKVHMYECKIPWSDVDMYRHTNYVAYIRYSIDCAMDGILTGAYSNFTNTQSQYLIKDTNIAFYNESVPNDVLQVASWEDKDNPYILRFDGTKDGKTIFQNSIEFYPEKSSL